MASKSDELLKTLARPSLPPPEQLEPAKRQEAHEAHPVKTPAQGHKPKSTGTDREQAALALYDDDRAVIQEMFAYLATQGERPTRNKIIRAALKVVVPNAAFLRAYQNLRDERVNG